MNKVIIYGHKLHTHTSSYVHYGYYKAFTELGYDTLWIDDNDDVSNINFDNCIFFTEGQVDKKIPLNNSSFYILHNCNKEKYENINKKINIQFFHNSIEKPQPNDQHYSFTTSEKLDKINNFTYLSKSTLYQPWATDLLPKEIDLNNARNEINNKECVWIGTYGGGDTDFQNGKQLNPFFEECKKNGINVKIIDPWSKPVSPEINKELVNKSYLAPAIQGAWQVKYGYAPCCRLLKNISYGHMAITNNETANSLFDNKLIYDSDTKNLFYKAIDKKNDPQLINEIKFLMNEVKINHTFINRAEQIIKLL